MANQYKTGIPGVNTGGNPAQAPIKYAQGLGQSVGNSNPNFGAYGPSPFTPVNIYPASLTGVNIGGLLSGLNLPDYGITPISSTVGSGATAPETGSGINVGNQGGYTQTPSLNTPAPIAPPQGNQGYVGGMHGGGLPSVTPGVGWGAAAQPVKGPNVIGGGTDTFNDGNFLTENADTIGAVLGGLLLGPQGIGAGRNIGELFMTEGGTYLMPSVGQLLSDYGSLGHSLNVGGGVLAGDAFAPLDSSSYQINLDDYAQDPWAELEEAASQQISSDTEAALSAPASIGAITGISGRLDSLANQRQAEEGGVDYSGMSGTTTTGGLETWSPETVLAQIAAMMRGYN